MKLSYPVSSGRLLDLADVFFRDFAADGNCARSWSPAVSVVEDAAGYRISTDLPGVTTGDVKVVVREGVLTISGERKTAETAEGEKSHLTERVFGAFQRAFTLPKNANGESVSAAFKDGVLNVTVPKREEVKPREIEVAVG